jgi:hypothetical protein
VHFFFLKGEFVSLVKLSMALRFLILYALLDVLLGGHVVYEDSSHPHPCMCACECVHCILVSIYVHFFFFVCFMVYNLYKASFVF